MKKYALAFVFLLALPFSIFAQWISLGDSKAPGKEPVVTLLSDDNRASVIKIDIPGFTISDLTVDGKTYQQVDFMSDVFTNEPGNPMLPYIAKVLAVPNQASVSVEVIETSEEKVFKDIYLPPARTSWYEGAEESPYLENKTAYLSGELYPAIQTTNDDPSIFPRFPDFACVGLSVSLCGCKKGAACRILYYCKGKLWQRTNR